MKVDFKKLLLAGTAVVAVSSVAAQAQAASLTMTANGIWANGAGGAGAAVAGDNVNLDTFALTVTNDQTADDNSGLDTFVLGTITSAAAGDLIIVQDAGGLALDVTVKAASVGDDLTIDNDDGADADVDVVFTNALTVGGDLTITNNDADADVDVNTSVGGALTVTGVTTLASNAGAAAANTTLTLSGNATFTGGAVLDTTNGGVAALVFDGASAQTVAGDIDGTTGTDENITVSNAAGVTFTGAIGSGQALDVITVDNGTSNSKATFKGDVSAADIVLGDNAGTDTNTVTFNASTADIAVTGAIAAAGATDTNNIVVAGGTGKTVTFATGMGTNIDTITVNAGTTLANTGGGAIVATDVSLGSASVLKLDTASAGHSFDLNGKGTLDVNANSTIAGNVGDTTALTAVDVATGTTLTLSAAAADRVLKATTITLNGTGALALTLGNDVGITGAIAAAADGDGAISLSAAAGDVTMNGAIGADGKNVNTLTFADNVAATTLTTSNNLYVNTITLGANDTLTLTGSGQVVDGVITSAGAGKGNLVVGDGVHTDSVTFGGAIGGTTLGSVKVNEFGTANISNHVKTTAAGAGVVGVDIDGTLNIASDGAAVTVSTAVGDTDLDGTVAVTGDDSVTISAGSDLFIDGTLSSELNDGTIDGTTTKALNLTGTGTVVIGGTSDTTLTFGNDVALTGAVTIGDGTTVTTLNVASTSDYTLNGETVVTSAGNVTLTAGSVLKVGLASGSLSLDDGDAFTVLQSAGGTNLATALGADDIVLVDTGFVDFQDDASDATHLNVKVVVADAADVLTSTNAVGAANSMLDVSAADAMTAGDEFAEARGNLLSAATEEEATTVAESLAPTTDNGAIVGAVNVSNRVVGVTSTRMAALRDGSATSGVAAGNMGQGMRGWVQGFGQAAQQDRRDGVDGYDADTYGVAVGADGETVSGGNVGVALSYGNTQVDGDAGFGSETDVDSYQISVYGDAPLSDMMYVQGMVAYAWNNIDSTRFNVGGTGLNANGESDANQFTAYAEVGRDFAQGGGMTLTPHALANWTYVDQDDYTETGAGALNLTVDPETVQIFELGVGADAAWDIQNSNGTSLKPVLSAGVRYDLLGDSADSTATFTGAGAAFSTQGLEPGRTTLNLGAGVTYYTLDNWELSAEYDYEYKADFDAHSGQMRAAFHF